VNGDGRALRDYHERTKHSPASVRANPHFLDWDNQPLPFKVYPNLAGDPLPTELPGSQRFTLDAIGGTAAGPGPSIDRPRLAHLLHFCAGIVRQRHYAGGDVYYRAAACTGALYHLDVYVVCAALDGVEAGVHHFGPHDFALHRLRAGDHRAHVIEAAGAEPAVARAPVLLVFASTFWRNAWKYRTRTYRHCFWDAGTMLANLLATSVALDVPATVVTGFVDDGLVSLLDLDPAREAPLAIVALGSDAPPPPPGPALAPLGLATLPLSREPIDYPALAEAQAASALASPGAVATWRAATAAPRADESFAHAMTPRPPSSVAEPIEATILRRGSTRRFPLAPIPVDALATVLHLATAPVPLDVHAPSRCYLLAHAVDGLVSGAYAVAADGGSVELLRAGDFRREAGFLGLGQELPADAAACLYWLVDLEPVFARLGDRGYRAAQLEAAIAGGRTYLAAYAQRLGATGLTFFDDDVTRFFSPHGAGASVMFHVAIGRRGGAAATRAS
jgi:SagB-type dehydrogenase family enzyme